MDFKMFIRSLFICIISTVHISAMAQLFELRDESGKIGYLFGSLHGAIAKINVQSKSIAPLIEKSKIVAFETIGGIPLQIRKNKLALQDGKSLFETVPADIFICTLSAYKNMQNGNKDSDEIRTLLKLHPMLFAFSYYGYTIDKLDKLDKLDKAIHSDNYDRLIYNLANFYKKSIANIESIDEKVMIVNKFDRQDAFEIIKNLCMVNESDQKIYDFTKLQSTIVQSYLLNDMDKLVETHIDMYKFLGVQDDFIDIFWTQRNLTMAKKIIGLIANDHHPFVAIGASHLGGADGLLSLMAKRGVSSLPLPIDKK